MTQATNQSWSEHFSEPTNAFVTAFTASIPFDKRLYHHDIRSSIAHATMLARVGLLTDDERDCIVDGLNTIEAEIERGDGEWPISLEDIHMNIEARLTNKIGITSKKLHTGRSRNDQIATDIRLYLRDEIDAIATELSRLRSGLIELADREADTIMPSFNRLQTTQPVTFGHHLLAWQEMLTRDHERLLDCRKRVNVLPLGAAALAGGTTHPIDRHVTAELLGFERPSENSLDTVSDHDFAIEFTSFASILLMHLSRMSEEMVLWTSSQFDFVDLSARFCTDSSLMPKKKYSDVLELVCGKTGRVYGHLMSLLTLMKSQSLTYNKDNQEDKELLFDTLDTVRACLHAFADMAPSLVAKPENMLEAARLGFSTTTNLADYLVRAGITFRDSREIVDKAITYGIEQGKNLSEMSLEELQRFSDAIGEDVFEVLTLEGSVAARNHIGGAAPDQVRAAAQRARDSLPMLQENHHVAQHIHHHLSRNPADIGRLRPKRSHLPTQRQRGFEDLRSARRTRGVTVDSATGQPGTVSHLANHRGATVTPDASPVYYDGVLYAESIVLDQLWPSSMEYPATLTPPGPLPLPTYRAGRHTTSSLLRTQNQFQPLLTRLPRGQLQHRFARQASAGDLRLRLRHGIQLYSRGHPGEALVDGNPSHLVRQRESLDFTVGAGITAAEGKLMLLNFTKMHGLGNDFMVVDLITQHAYLRDDQIHQLADRHFGVGFDQLLLVEPPRRPDMDFRYRIFNADGSEVENCGNGARCFARFVIDQRLTHKREFQVETLGGPLSLKVDDDGLVQVDMGTPCFAPLDVPFVADRDGASYHLDINGQAVIFSIASMGNPHAVLQIDDVDTALVGDLGPKLQQHPSFPRQANIGFMQVKSPHAIRLRVYERGVGETLACGTGACAAVACGIRQGVLQSPVDVELRGGHLTLEWKGGKAPIIMTGPAERVFEGRVVLNQ